MEHTSNETVQSREANVREVARIAQEELFRLYKDLSTLSKRIGTIRRTLAGMANVFGEQFFSEELLELMGRKSPNRKSGLTSACREALLGAKERLSAADLCDCLRSAHPGLLDRHKNPIASVSTVMHRLVGYGEAREVIKENRRAWEPAESSTRETEQQFETR